MVKFVYRILLYFECENKSFEISFMWYVIEPSERSYTEENLFFFCVNKRRKKKKKKKETTTKTKKQSLCIENGTLKIVSSQI